MHFTKKERCLFQFWNGEKNVKADPDAIQRKLLAANPNWALDIKRLVAAKLVAERMEAAEKKGEELSKLDQQTITSAMEAMDRVLSAVRKSFKIKDVDDDGNGLTEQDLLELSFVFRGYMSDLKKNGPDTPTSDQPTPVASDN